MSRTVQGTVRRVVVAHDGSPSARAGFAAALDIADVRGSELLLLSTVDVDPGLPLEWVRLGTLADEVVREAVQVARARLGDDRVAAAVLPGEASAVVLGSLRTGDLAVLGSHSHGPLARALLGSVSRRVAVHAPVPVLVVPPGPAPSADAEVVVGVDGSDGSLEALRFAAEEADRRGSTLRAVLVVDVPADATGTVAGPDHPELQAARAHLHEALAGLREDRPSLHVAADVVQGTPFDALVDRARRARLVVVGSHGRGAVRAALLGSVGRRLLEHAPCPVVVVH